MKTVLIGLTRLWRRRKRPGFGLPSGIALAMLALVVIPIGAVAEAPAKLSPTNQFLTAYTSMSTADWLTEKGMRAEAIDLYTEALNLFIKVSADYPQWQPAVVAFRINYCREALVGIERPPAKPGIALRAGNTLSGERGAPPDAGRQLAEDGLKRTPDESGGEEKQTSNAQRPPLNVELKTKNKEQKTKNASAQRPTGSQSATSNQQSKTSNFSPLNFKLQQAALKERGRDYTGALAMYIALMEEYPQEPWALKGACRCCLRLGRMDQARTLTRQALTLPLPDADLNLLTALVDCHDGRYQAAIPLLHQSLKQNSACPEAHTALGVALAATGAIKEAQEEMKRALSLNPKLGDAYYNLARLSLRQKPTDHDMARAHYQNALQHGAAPDPELDALLAE